MLNRLTRRAAPLLALLLPLLSAAPAMAAPDVVVTIRPLHSLTAEVMEGVGEPTLLLKSAASPHSYAMRPSDALALNRADLVIWTGEAMETFLTRILPQLPAGTEVMTATDAPGLTLLPVRAPDAGEDEDHEEHGEDGHEHDASLPDAHIWLDPDNAASLLTAIAERLSAVDPDHAAAYNANAEMAKTRLLTLTADIAAELAPLGGRRYMAGHDAYQYFERAFGLSFGGAITAHPGRPPSARHMLEITGRIRDEQVGCLLTEPGNHPPLFERLAKEEGLKIADADPLGLAIAPGPGLYEEMMRRMADSIAACLSPGE